VDTSHAPLLKNMVLVDSPGILQRVHEHRSDAMNALIDASDLVIMMLDIKLNDPGPLMRRTM